MIARAAETAEAWIAWAPGWLVGLGLAVLAGLLALSAYGLVERLLLRAATRRKAGWASFLPRTRGIFRAALVLLAVNLVIQSSLFPGEWTRYAARLLWVGMILLLGWAATIGIDVLAALRARRYRIDVADNLQARKHLTQLRIVKRTLTTVVVILTAGAALMTFDSVRNFGVSLFASAGAAGLVVGLAARPVLSNLIAGLQLAVTQPIRIDDVVEVEKEFGRVEEIGDAFVVIRLWDLRRQVVPLSYFMENPFLNYTRTSAALVGTVTLPMDHAAPVAPLRAEAARIVAASELWDRRSLKVQVTEFTDTAVEVRILVSAANSEDLWDLRCLVREELLAYIQQHLPESLPQRRVSLDMPAQRAPSGGNTGGA